MAINPTIEQYIADLLNDNESDFALIYSCRSKAREKSRVLISLCEKCKTEKDFKQVFGVLLDLIRYFSLIRLTRKDINKRLDEIKEIRHGS